MSELVVAFPKMEDAKAIKNILAKNGFRVAGLSQSAAGAIQLCDSYGSGILICAYQFADMMFEEVRENLNPNFQMILLCSKARLNENLPDNVFFLPMPLKVHDFIDTVYMIGDRMRREKKKKNKRIERSEKDEEILNQAKLLLMERNGMSEEQAHHYLQKSSMENGCNLIEVAQMVISLYDS
ncbi:antitermination regulator [Lachnospiraceae bacterium oral taxon 096]|nr:antitermination regulator [Lachnospiraceae bacterium oral taxon 096]QUI95384.1 ANTAR domain-containing protein [Lachnospiraceae bacterium oral taxon 096]